MTKKTGNIALSIGMIAVATAFLFERELHYPSNVFPYAIITLIVVLSLIILIRSLGSKPADASEEVEPGEHLEYRRVAIVAVASVVYVAVFFFVGFYVSSFVYLVVLSYVLRSAEGTVLRRLAGSAIMAFIVCSLILLMFDVLLRVPTPDGLLF